MKLFPNNLFEGFVVCFFVSIFAKRMCFILLEAFKMSRDAVKYQPPHCFIQSVCGAA